jgi:hypothetical protein
MTSTTRCGARPARANPKRGRSPAAENHPDIELARRLGIYSIAEIEERWEKAKRPAR